MKAFYSFLVKGDSGQRDSGSSLGETLTLRRAVLAPPCHHQKSDVCYGHSHRGNTRYPTSDSLRRNFKTTYLTQHLLWLRSASHPDTAHSHLRENLSSAAAWIKSACGCLWRAVLLTDIVGPSTLWAAPPRQAVLNYTSERENKPAASHLEIQMTSTYNQYKNYPNSLLHISGSDELSATYALSLQS